MNKTVLFIIGVIILGVAAYFLFFNNQTSTNEPVIQEKSDTMMEDSEQTDDQAMEEKLMGDETTAMDSYTLDDVSKHDNKDDCWLAIEGTVYDVTQFIADNKHPGGAAILEGCGKDATELFNDRPNGSGAHSEIARGFLPEFKIGSLSE